MATAVGKSFLLDPRGDGLLYTADAGGPTTELGSVAEGMVAGQWVTLTSNGMNPALGPSGGLQGHYLPYAQEPMLWFPSEKKARIVTGDHNGGIEIHLVYDDVTNTWLQDTMYTNWGEIPAGSGNNQTHAYGYNASDLAGGRLIFMFEDNVWSNSTQSWAENAVPQNPFWSALRANSVYSYFPGKGLTEFSNGGLWLLNETLTAWSEIAPQDTYFWDSPQGLTPVGIYNPVHDVVVFGGCNNTNQLYTWDRNDVIRAMPTAGAPVQISGDNGGRGFPGTVTKLDWDPVSGDLLIFETRVPGVTELYSYSFAGAGGASGTWAQLPTTPLGRGTDDFVSFACTDYGVNVTAEFNIGNNQGTMRVYKHA